MTRRGLITNYLREAVAKAGSDVTAQLAWLEAKRVALTEEVESGGQMTLGAEYKSNKTTFDGGIPPGLRLEAVNAAIDILNNTPGGGGSLLVPRYQQIPL